MSGTKEPKGAGTFSLHTCVTPYWRKSYPPLPCLPAVWRAPAGAATHPPYRFPSAFIGGFKNHQPRREEAVQGKGGSVVLPPHVNSGTDPAIYSARKISGRPCVPGRLWKNRAQADRLRLGFSCSVSSSSAGGRLCQDFRPRRASRRSSARTEPTGPKPTRPEKGRARLATGLNRLFSSWDSSGFGVLRGLLGPSPETFQLTFPLWPRQDMRIGRHLSSLSTPSNTGRRQPAHR